VPHGLTAHQVGFSGIRAVYLGISPDSPLCLNKEGSTTTTVMLFVGEGIKRFGFGDNLETGEAHRD